MNRYFSRQCPPGTVQYVIQAGDTFFGIANRFWTKNLHSQDTFDINF